MLAAWSTSMRGGSQWPLFSLTSAWSLDLRWLSLSWRRFPFWVFDFRSLPASKVCISRVSGETSGEVAVVVVLAVDCCWEPDVVFVVVVCIIYLQDNARLKVCQVQNHEKRASWQNFNLRLSTFSLSFIGIWVFNVFSVCVCVLVCEWL